MDCVNCTNKTNKYKCSKCLSPYCSLKCYKEHKDSTQCAEHAATQDITQQQLLMQPGKVPAAEEEPTVYAPFSTEDTVPLEKLQQLANCKELHQLLYNPHLRTLLQQIDVAHNASLTMTAAMQEPLFIEFANACLQVVEPMTDAEKNDLDLRT